MAAHFRSTSFALQLPILSLLVLSFVALTVTARFQRPAGLPDGLYVGYIDELGAHQLKFVEDANYTAAGEMFPSSEIQDLKFLGTGVQCSRDIFLTADDVQQAITGLATFFGAGNAFYGLSVSYYHGTAVAYGCNYGYGQSYSSKQLWNDENEITDTCGNTAAGWFGHQNWNSAYGRTSSSKGFCF